MTRAAPLAAASVRRVQVTAVQRRVSMAKGAPPTAARQAAAT